MERGGVVLHVYMFRTTNGSFVYMYVWGRWTDGVCVRKAESEMARKPTWCFCIDCKGNYIVHRNTRTRHYRRVGRLPQSDIDMHPNGGNMRACMTSEDESSASSSSEDDDARQELQDAQRVRAAENRARTLAMLGGSSSEDDDNNNNSRGGDHNNSSSDSGTDSDLEECVELQDAILAWLEGTYIHCLVV
jgi:hypothetical protein